MLIRQGVTIHNPLTQSQTVVLESDQETQGMGWLLEVTCQPNTKPDIAEHRHLTWTETFEIISGEACYSLDGKQQTLKAGESFQVKPNQAHIHPWNASDQLMVYRQRNLFDQANPAAVQDVLGVFATVADLARQGKVNAQGLPKNPLQLAATARTLGRYGGYDTRMPIPLQKVLSATLGRLAEFLGYRGVYPN